MNGMECTIDIDVTGAFRLARAAGKVMVAQGSGSIGDTGLGFERSGQSTLCRVRREQGGRRPPHPGARR